MIKCPVSQPSIQGEEINIVYNRILQVGQVNFNSVSKCQSLSCAWLFATPWTGAYQDPSVCEISRQEYWSGLPFSFSRVSSQPRDRTRVSCTAGRFFTDWAKVLIPTLPKSTVKLESHSLLVFLYVVFLIALTSIHRWKTCNSFHYCQVLSLITLIIGATKISDAKKRLRLMNYTPSPLWEP